MNNIQHNAAVKYLEKNQYRVKCQNSNAMVWCIGIMALIFFFYILKFIVALP